MARSVVAALGNESAAVLCSLAPAGLSIFHRHRDGERHRERYHNNACPGKLTCCSGFEEIVCQPWMRDSRPCRIWHTKGITARTRKTLQTALIPASAKHCVRAKFGKPILKFCLKEHDSETRTGICESHFPSSITPVRDGVVKAARPCRS